MSKEYPAFFKRFTLRLKRKEKFGFSIIFLNLYNLNKPMIISVFSEYTVDSEIFARTEFLLIFANSLHRLFKVLANIENTLFWIAIQIIQIVACE